MERGKSLKLKPLPSPEQKIKIKNCCHFKQFWRNYIGLLLTQSSWKVLIGGNQDELKKNCEKQVSG